jgi:acetoin utilization deacetylase AcuC-like enzyme
VRRVAAIPAARAALERVHHPAYLDRLESLREAHHQFDLDTRAAPGSIDAAWLAAGAALQAVEAVVDGSANNAFALVRPPGHHAEPDRAMGFCFINNVAAAAARGLELGCRRVLIVDWDVHHGNGTQRIFEARSDVLAFSVHQWPMYPGTGAARQVGVGAGRGFTVNLPLPAGQRDGDYVRAMQDVLVPIAEAYAPDLVLIAAGFDAHRADPLGGMLLTEAGFASILAIVRGVADRHAGGRLALCLEGGYDLAALAASTCACIAGLSPSAPRVPLVEPAPRSPELARAVEAQRAWWPSLG